MVKDSPLASHCRTLRSPSGEECGSRHKRQKIQKTAEKDRASQKKTRTCVGLLQHVPKDDGGKIPHDLRFTVMADCIGEAEAATEAQLASTFSNRLFSRSKSATITSDDGKRKLGPSRVQRHQAGIFPKFPRRLNWGLK